MADPTARFVLHGDDQTGPAFASASKNFRELERGTQSISKSLRQWGREINAVLGLYGAFRAVHFFEGIVSDAYKANQLTEDQKDHVDELRSSYDKLRGAAGRFIAEAFAPTQVSSGIFNWLTAAIDKAAELEHSLRAISDKYVRNPLFGARFTTGGGFGQDDLEEIDNMVSVANQLKKIQPFAQDFSKGQQLSPQLEEFIAQLKTAADLADELRTPLEKDLELVAQVRDLMAKGLLPADSIARLGDELLQPIIVAKGMLHELKPEAEKWAQELGQGMKSAFAGWLAGTETSFRDLLKRMAAELVSSALFSALASTFGGGGGFWASVFGGKRANGGPVSAGRSYLVGERGPEVVTMGASGFVTPNGGGGLVYAPVTNIDARNAAPGVEGGIRALLEQNNRRQKAEIADLIRRGRFAK